jgi:peptidyl-prolyl cis-trans isomerase D
MAMISKIRSKAGLLIGIVGFSLLAFILGDLLSHNRDLFSSNDSSVGVISGNKIDVRDFEDQVQLSVNNYKLNNNTETVDQNTMDQLREQTWNQLVNNEIMGKQFTKLGLNVSPDELFDMVKGKNPHPQIKQAFTDPKTGEFSTANVINFLKNMDNDKTGRTRAQWNVFEKAIMEERLQQKYNDLVKQGLFVSSVEAKEDFISKNRFASVKFVFLPYSTVVDSTIKVSDADLKAVYNANLKRYKQEASRGIDYVTFEVTPSQVDLKAAKESINKTVEEFRATTNDSLFVAQNSDAPFDANFKKRGSFSPNIDSVMFNSAIGTLVGPYEENNGFKIAKLVAVKMLPDSVNARHILLKVADATAKDAVMKTADSLKAAIKSGSNFAVLSALFSTDEGSKIKGGDLGWFGPGMMVPEFNDACFNGNKGDVTIVQTQFGIHIIEIVNQSGMSKQIQVAIVDRKIEASSKTYQMVYAKANEFANKNNTAVAFDKAVKDQNLSKLLDNNILENAKQVGGLENSRELVRWAFKAEVGDVSKAFEFGNKFTVAKLTTAKEKGFSTLEEVKDQVTFEARRDKKAEQFIEKFNKAGKSSLASIATSVGQVEQSAEQVNFAATQLGAGGMEPAVVGAIMTMKPNTISPPIKGMNGVFVVSVNSFTEPVMPKDIKETRQQVVQQLQQRASYEVNNALREKANINDRRGKFY